MPVKPRNSIQALQEEIAAYRRAMHENPGLAYEEEFASALVAEKLGEWGITFERGLGKTGIVATIEGQESGSGRAIGLRADMDALPITEEGNKPWASKNKGLMHACGHDGHTAILLGTAKYLQDSRNFNGRVHLIFQPAEEGARGANAMMEDGLFERFPCDAVYGLHNWPDMPRGAIGMRPGPIMASSDIFTLTVHGQGGHAAMPHKTVDPVVIGAQIITALQTLVSRTVDPVDTAVLSITNFNAGTGAHNIIPDRAEMIGTVRTFSEATRQALKAKIGEIAAAIAGSMGGSAGYAYKMVIDATINDPEQTAFCAKVAEKVFGADNMDTAVAPCMGGEDFGAMLARVPGAYVWLGQAEPDAPESNHNRGLHTPRYDFNDALIPLAMEYWASLVEAAMPLKK